MLSLSLDKVYEFVVRSVLARSDPTSELRVDDNVVFDAGTATGKSCWMTEPPSFFVVVMSSGIEGGATKRECGLVKSRGVGSCGIVFVQCVGRMTGFSSIRYFNIPSASGTPSKVYGAYPRRSSWASSRRVRETFCKQAMSLQDDNGLEEE